MTVVVAHVIGQTPRPDLSSELERRLPWAQSRVVGALDGLGPDEVAPCEPGGYPLETRLRGGERVLLDAGFVAPLLQKSIDEHDDGASSHLILCAGPFPELAAPASPLEGPTPLIRPFDVAAATLAERGCRRLAVMVPFAAQATPAIEKWTQAGFTCDVHALTARPAELALPDWVAGLIGEGGADALAFDYVGFPPSELADVSARLEIPVFDLGHLALDALEEILSPS